MEEIGRVKRSKEQTKASYDRLSSWYDFLAGGMEKRFRDAGLARLDVQEREQVLEVGFGTGYCILALARSVGDDGRVYGLDISEGMLSIAASRLEKAGLAQRVELQCGDATNLPYAEDLFDAIFISFALELFDTPDIPIVLRQFQRVLRSGGRIGVVSMSKEEKAGPMARLYDWGHERFPDYIDCRPIYVSHALASAGFEITEATTMSLLGLPVAIVLAGK